MKHDCKFKSNERMAMARFRKTKKLNQESLASTLKVSQGTISNVERGYVSDGAKSTYKMRNWKMKLEIDECIKNAFSHYRAV